MRKLAESGMYICTNLDTAPLACSVPFLPHESICKASECIVLMGQNKIVLAAPGMLPSQLPIWATFCRRQAYNVGPCQRTWHATRMCTRTQLVNIVCITMNWGLMVRAVVLAAPEIWANSLVRWESVHGATSGCCTHTI
jgi:hypothetical protein